jgi:branched-chain amino acid transport system ATP-binding protein
MSGLEVVGLTTKYGGIVAVDDVALAVAAGQAVAIVGANGAGKTTLLKTICGLVRAAQGEVRFDGARLTGRPAYAVARAGIVMVPEGRRILGALTIEENLRLGHRAAARRGGVAEEDLARVFALFPILAERRRQHAGELSGGQQQMLAIGRAMMGRPRLLLLDEPSLGLAPTIVAQVFAVLARLHGEGLGMLLVEQNARRALEVTEHAYVMERGRIVHEGPSHALRADPAMIDHYLGSVG